MDEIYKVARKAYELAIGSGHTDELQEVACKDPYQAYHYARDVKGADIGYCQEAACKKPYLAYCFARDIKGADIECCQKMACKNPQCAYYFAKDIIIADFDKYLEVVKGTKWEDKLRKLVLERGLG